MPVSVGEVDSWAWSPDGKAILYSRDEGGVGNIWWMPLAGRVPKKLTNFNSEKIFSFGLSPDNRLAMSRGEYLIDVAVIKYAR